MKQKPILYWVREIFKLQEVCKDSEDFKNKVIKFCEKEERKIRKRFKEGEK